MFITAFYAEKIRRVSILGIVQLMRIIVMNGQGGLCQKDARFNGVLACQSESLRLGDLVSCSAPKT